MSTRSTRAQLETELLQTKEELAALRNTIREYVNGVECEDNVRQTLELFDMEPESAVFNGSITVDFIITGLESVLNSENEVNADVLDLLYDQIGIAVDRIYDSDLGPNFAIAINDVISEYLVVE